MRPRSPHSSTTTASCSRPARFPYTAAPRSSPNYARAGGPLQLRAIGFAAHDTIAYVVGMFRGAGEQEVGKFLLALRRRDPRQPWLIAADALGIPLQRGRALHPDDRTAAAAVVVISRSLAEQHFPGVDPVGRRMRTLEAERTIVGVVGDVSMFTLDRAPEPTIYVPNEQAPEWMRDDPTLIVRTSLEPDAVLASVRAAIRGVDGRVPIAYERTMRGIIDSTLVLPRFRTVLMALFALIALVLAVVGIYGTVAYAVTRRTREFAIRAALGATRRDILLLVLSDGIRPVLVGAAAGVFLAGALSRLAAAMLFQVSAHDATTFVATPLAFGALAVLAALLPARRASRAAPLSAMHDS